MKAGMNTKQLGRLTRMVALLQLVRRSTSTTWHELPERAEAFFKDCEKDPVILSEIEYGNE